MSAPRRLPVVYLAGCGHTGSTLLALFVDSHPRIASVGETSFKPKQQRRKESNITCTCGRYCVECPFWQQVFRGVNDAGFEFGALQWSNDFRYKNRFAHKLLSRYSGSPARRMLQRAAALLPSHRSRLERVRRVNVEFIRTVLRVAGADVFFDSSKKAVRLHNLIETPELDVKVIRLVRDVRGYVSSAKKRGESVEDAARGWRHVHETLDSVTRGLPQDRVMVLRYEDVCSDPRTWLKRTYEFCGVDAIDPPPAVVSSDHHVLGNNMRRNEKIEIRLDESWRSRLNREEQERARTIAGTFHGRFGYAAQ